MRCPILHVFAITINAFFPQDSASYILIEAMRDILSQSSGAVIITHCNAGLLPPSFACDYTNSRVLISHRSRSGTHWVLVVWKC